MEKNMNVILYIATLIEENMLCIHVKRIGGIGDSSRILARVSVDGAIRSRTWPSTAARPRAY